VGGSGVIGLDVGTTAVKAGLYRADGDEVAVASSGHPLRTPRPGWAEQDPDEIVATVFAALADVLRTARGDSVEIAGICVSSPMHGLLGLDRDGRPLTPLVTWADTRARADAEHLRAEHFDVYRRTGTPLHPMAPLAKLRWFHRERADVAARVHLWVTLKEYLLQALTGTTAIDRSSASATGLFALDADTWDDEALALAGIDASHLAPVVATDDVLGGLTATVAGHTGLRRGTAVVAGATDGVLANLGVGALGDDGVGAVTIGTSGAVRLTVREPATDRRMRTFCYALQGDHWVVGGAISNGGLWLRWLRQKIFEDDVDDEVLSALADATPAGSDGVTVLPYLTGERAPQWSAEPAGVIFGLRLDHGRGHLVRAGMEGVAHQLRLVLDALADGGHDVSLLRATGGFTRSPVWVQTVADVLDVPLEIPSVAEATACGAALLGMTALGVVDGIVDASALVAPAIRCDPDQRQRATHDAAHARYVELVDVLSGPFARLPDAGGSEARGG
jgi:gluconokinase